MSPAPPRSVTVPGGRGRWLLAWLALAGIARAEDAADRPAPAAKAETPLLNNPFDRIQFMPDGSSSHYLVGHKGHADAEVYYFPPFPPALDDELQVLPPLDSRPPAPREAAPFVGESFYPMLADRLANEGISSGTRDELAAFRAARSLLRQELETEIAGRADADPAARSRRLAALAATQRARLEILEAAAEKLRSALARTDVTGQVYGAEDWARSATWGKGVVDAASPLPDRHQRAVALRCAAFFQAGLSAGQRRLLVDMAGELDRGDHGAAAPVDPSHASWHFAFLPETSSIRLPDSLPAALAGKLSQFTRRRSALQDDLLAALRDNAGKLQGARASALARLAAVQAEPLAALEVLAEEIRGDLAGLPNLPGPPSPPALPPELTARIAAYRAHKVELLHQLYRLLAPAAADGKAPDATTVWVRDQASATKVGSANLRVTTEEFNRQQRILVGSLNLELADIRTALADYARAANRPADRKSVNDLLTDFERARQSQETWDRYRDYHAAMLLPGLSPAQRRLLFSAALEELAQPLPGGLTAE